MSDAFIPLSQGKHAVVDAADSQRVCQHFWYASECHGIWYAKTNIADETGRHTVSLHRFILGLRRGDGVQGDHKDGDGLNNRRSNLRTATSVGNAANRTHRSGSSRYKGIRWRSDCRMWHAQCGPRGSNTHVGYYRDEVDAALAYDAAAIRQYGAFAKPNFLEARDA